MPPDFDPPLRLLKAEENIYRLPCFDCRGYTRAAAASPSDPQAVTIFNELRLSDGRETIGTLPEDARPMPCRLHYPRPAWSEGPLFKARSMEEKWDIYFWEGQLYFARSWSGLLIFRARVEQTETETVITQVDASLLPGNGDPDLAISAVDFLVKSHLYNLDVPVHLPEIKFDNPVEAARFKDNEAVEIARMVFREYGRKAGFATYGDTLSLPGLFDRGQYLPGAYPLGLDNLKPHLEVSQERVECPVTGCAHTVERQRQHFRRQPQFQCPEHSIYISPTTFEYSDLYDNLLWREPADRSLLESIFNYKRENRLGRDNSEDALTWNVVRGLEQCGLLADLLSSIHGSPLDGLELLYWGYSQAEGGIWSELKAARKTFGELPQRGSEPDLIVRTNQALFLIEAKFTSTIDTHPSKSARPASKKGYLSGADGWFYHVFQTDYDSIAILSQKYELMRFWLLGSHIAKRLGLAFYLVSLTPTAQVDQTLAQFGPHLAESEAWHFVATAWEEIYHFGRDHALPTPQAHRLLAYLENKTAGYDRQGQLQPAFPKDFLFF